MKVFTCGKQQGSPSPSPSPGTVTSGMAWSSHFKVKYGSVMSEIAIAMRSTLFLIFVSVSCATGACSRKN